MTSEKTWGRDQTQQAADAIRHLRGDNTVQWLADRTSELGFPISRSRISDIERGNRGALLSVAELVILAKALAVPPLLLLYPGVPGEVVEVIPEVRTLAIAAAQWFSGEQPFQHYGPDPDGKMNLTYWGDDLRAQYEGGVNLRLAREEQTIRSNIQRLEQARREWAMKKAADVEELRRSPGIEQRAWTYEESQLAAETALANREIMTLDRELDGQMERLYENLVRQKELGMKPSADDIDDPVTRQRFLTAIERGRAKIQELVDGLERHRDPGESNQ
ncbi:hypothetical protein [Williamsia sp. DF01-3]|uniref:hypothetical protein n=1 Tax=Williamsia sp. DF01-3 TaxID=2934157 RepID=UPI001FF3846C|nr:hypothetical protein [Williamsia sp. DF01-3]MCK0516968.1 hypothetical protein [Williamsia sp. DF01-3]